MNKKRVGVLISGGGSNMKALVTAGLAKMSPFEIVCVASNNADASGITWARGQGIETKVISHKDYDSRVAFDRALHKILSHSKIEIVCLAGFMRILSPWFVKQWEGKMLNIHPSLLPNFKGGHAVRDALAAGAKETGCSVHFVTEEMDEGPVVGQRAVPILPNDTEETLLTRIHEQEHILYPQALRELIQKTPR